MTLARTVTGDSAYLRLRMSKSITALARRMSPAIHMHVHMHMPAGLLRARSEVKLVTRSTDVGLRDARQVLWLPSSRIKPGALLIAPWSIGVGSPSSSREATRAASNFLRILIPGFSMQ